MQSPAPGDVNDGEMTFDCGDISANPRRFDGAASSTISYDFDDGTCAYHCDLDGQRL